MVHDAGRIAASRSPRPSYNDKSLVRGFPFPAEALQVAGLVHPHKSAGSLPTRLPAPVTSRAIVRALPEMSVSACGSCPRQSGDTLNAQCEHSSRGGRGSCPLPASRRAVRLAGDAGAPPVHPPSAAARTRTWGHEVTGLQPAGNAHFTIDGMKRKVEGSNPCACTHPGFRDRLPTIQRHLP